MRDQILKKLQVIVRDVLDDDTLILSEKQAIDEFEEWDSVAHMTIMALLESEYQIEFDIERITNVKTVMDIVNMLV